MLRSVCPGAARFETVETETAETAAPHCIVITIVLSQTSIVPMSDTTPSINITRGKKSEDELSSSTDASTMPDALSMASGLAEGARTIWLAGLGAVSMAEELGAKTFETLVSEGKSWEAENAQSTPTDAEDGGVSAMDQLRKGGAQAVASIERRVREEVSDMMTQMGVPRRQDVDALRNEVRQLSDKVDQLAETLDADTTAG